MAIPSEIRAGTTLDLSWDASGYPASDSWTSKLVLRKDGTTASPIEVAGVADGDGWAADVAATTTQAWAPGRYFIVVEVAKGGEVFHPASGTVNVLARLDAANADLTQLETDLATVEETIRTAVADSDGLKSYSIETSTPDASGQRSYEYMDWSALRAHRAWLKREILRVKGELGLDSRKRGGWRKIKTALA